VGSGVCVTLIGKIVGHTGKCIDGMDVRAEFLGNEPPHGEILVVLSG